MRYLSVLFIGVLFGAGLALSGMTDSQKVIGFLNVAGDWDASLMFVMAGALAIAVPAFWFVPRREHPILADEFDLPPTKSVDSTLVAGGVLFGVGWGLFGYCPGPAIAALGYLEPTSFLFVAAMLGGMWLASMLSAKRVG